MNALRDCRELLAEAKRDADGWCERATRAEAQAEFFEREYEAAQEHVRELRRKLGIAEEPDDHEAVGLSVATLNKGAMER